MAYVHKQFHKTVCVYRQKARQKEIKLELTYNSAFKL